MAVVQTQKTRKLTVVVNEGTTESPSLKNRVIGNQYWINTLSEVTDEQLYTAASMYADLQAHTFVRVDGEDNYHLEEE